MCHAGRQAPSIKQPQRPCNTQHVEISTQGQSRPRSVWSTLPASQLLPFIHLKRGSAAITPGCVNVRLVAVIRISFVMEETGVGYADAVVRSIALIGAL